VSRAVMAAGKRMAVHCSLQLRSSIDACTCASQHWPTLFNLSICYLDMVCSECIPV
jgi:hypothetical protein